MYFSYMQSPVGMLLLAADESGLRHLCFPGAKAAQLPLDQWEEHPEKMALAITQLEEYFAGKRRHFEMPLNPVGSPFQRSVWQKLRDIPYGSTCSYAQIAAQIGSPKAVRAVGGANARNPIAILIPCHRVVGKNNTLTGFAGGLHRKQILLDIESNSQ